MGPVTWLWLLVLGLCVSSAPRAQPPIIFAVNEGATYRVTPMETRDRYRELGELLGRALKRPVQIEPIDDYVKLRNGLEEKRFDLAFIHPAHISLRAMRDQQYQLLVLTKGYTEYRARFLVRKDSTLKQAQEIKGRAMVMPDPDSITAWMTRAALRDMGIDPGRENLQTTRYQDAIPFYLDNGFADVGITAAGAVIKEWEGKGGRVLFSSRPVPIKHLIASPNLSPAEAARVREVFLGLDSSKEGQAILQRLGFAGFQQGDAAQLVELTRWLGL